MMTPARKLPGYVETKIKKCKSPGFKGLDALGLWYSFCVEVELEAWSKQCEQATLSNGHDMAAFTRHPLGYHIRRVLSDGKLLQVYDAHGNLLDDTLLSVRRRK